MQTDKIIEKAKKLGLDTGSSSSIADNLRHIAEQVGINDFNSITDVDKLEQVLDEQLNNQVSSDNSNISELQEQEVPEQQNGGTFGAKEYNQAKDENGRYNQEHYKAKQEELNQKLNDAKNEKSYANKKVGVDENGHNKYKNKNVLDKVNDRINVAKARQDIISNKLANAKANAYRAMHPGEALKDAAKDKAKGAVKNVGKKAGQAAAKATAKGVKVALNALIKFIVSNPYVLAILGVIGVILLVILFFAGTPVNNNSSAGYYDSECNYNETSVVLNSCNTAISTNLSLENYVIGQTYSYQNNNNYSDESLKSLMIIIKTNALSNGNYSNVQKKITIDDCALAYTKIDEIGSSELNKLKNLYASIAEKLFISESYQSSISSLSAANSLPLNQEQLDMISNSNDKYETILDEVYNSPESSPSSEKKILYNLNDFCTFYNLVQNSSYWWPIGSSSPTRGNIYAGAPTSINITSTFGPRVVEGKRNNHGAIDIAAPCNITIVIATKSGTVTTASNTCDNNGYFENSCGGWLGNHVKIDHGDGTSTVYGHLYPNSIRVSVGDKVEQGEKIGLVGNSGSSTGCHLHFGVSLNGVKVDPLNYVSPNNPRPGSAYNQISNNIDNNNQ